MQRHGIGRRATILGGLAGLAAAAAPVAAVMPVEVANRRCLVQVLLDGQVARMVLDTGSERTLVTRAAASRLGLRPDPWVSTTLRGAGGRVERHSNVDARQALAGNMPLFQIQPGSGLSLSVTSSDLGGADGLLGSDVLQHYALDLDIPGSRLALLTARATAHAADAVPLALLERNLLLARVTLDRHRLTALVDTGSSISIVNARGMIRLALAPEQIEKNPAMELSALGGRSLAYSHQFAEFRVGTLTVPNPTFLLEPAPSAAYDLVLGLDVLARQRLLLSYHDLTLAFPESGPQH